MALENNNILVVDDDPAQLRLMAKMLSRGGSEVFSASNGVDAMRVVADEEPRIIVTDWLMPEMDGLQLCRALREHEGVRFVYVIIVTGKEEKNSVVEAFEAGADDFLKKPIDRSELVARVNAAERIVRLESDLAKRNREVHRVNAEMALAQQRLNVVNDRLKRLTRTDELTGLLNRREALSRLSDLWAARERYGQRFSSLMLDIDHFKHINDAHGHAAGDTVLKETAALLVANTRKTDKVCRIGGEEFLILCPNAGLEGAVVCAEHIRAAIEQHQFSFDDSIRLTVSIGVGEPVAGIESRDDFLRVIDVALYGSKNAGRNRVSIAQENLAEKP